MARRQLGLVVRPMRPGFYPSASFSGSGRGGVCSPMPAAPSLFGMRHVGDGAATAIMDRGRDVPAGFALAAATASSALLRAALATDSWVLLSALAPPDGAARSTWVVGLRGVRLKAEALPAQAEDAAKVWRSLESQWLSLGFDEAHLSAGRQLPQDAGDALRAVSRAAAVVAECGRGASGLVALGVLMLASGCASRCRSLRSFACLLLLAGAAAAMLGLTLGAAAWLEHGVALLPEPAAPEFLPGPSVAAYGGGGLLSLLAGALLLSSAEGPRRTGPRVVGLAASAPAERLRAALRADAAAARRLLLEEQRRWTGRLALGLVALPALLLGALHLAGHRAVVAGAQRALGAPGAEAGGGLRAAIRAAARLRGARRRWRESRGVTAPPLGRWPWDAGANRRVVASGARVRVVAGTRAVARRATSAASQDAEGSLPTPLPAAHLRSRPWDPSGRAVEGRRGLPCQVLGGALLRTHA